MFVQFAMSAFTTNHLEILSPLCTTMQEDNHFEMFENDAHFAQQFAYAPEVTDGKEQLERILTQIYGHFRQRQWDEFTLKVQYAIVLIKAEKQLTRPHRKLLHKLFKKSPELAMDFLPLIVSSACSKAKTMKLYSITVGLK